jgi:2',3'-cyclic-nucleotide 2'-phosphodiesterase/3'-nucleotidase
MNKYKLRILQTSDVHGYVYPRSYSDNEYENTGLGQISTLISNLRTESTILIDSGDTIQGSPLTYYQAKENVGTVNPMALACNYLKYDFITLGNHEFNYGIEYLESYLNNIDAEILNSNLLNTNTNKPIYGNPYKILNILNGPKIAILGVTTHYIPNWEQGSHIQNITFNDAFETVKKEVNQLKEIEHPDFIIVNYHGGFERDFDTFELSTEDTGENQGSKMLKEINGIDLLLTGHQHRTLAGSLFGTHYIQPSFNGKGLGFADIEFTLVNKKWEYIVSDIKIIPTTDIKADQKLLALLNEYENKTQTFLDTPIGKTQSNLLITNQLDARLHKHPLVTLINQVQLKYSGADISLCSLGNGVSGFRKAISVRDVIGTYVFPNTLVVKEVTGRILKVALEKTSEFFELENGVPVFSPKFNTPKLQLYAYDMYDNINYTIDLRKPIGSRVSDILFEGKAIEDDKTYSVVMNNYRAAGGGDYLFFKESHTIKDINLDVIELLINYIYEEKEIVVNDPKNITIIY